MTVIIYNHNIKSTLATENFQKTYGTFLEGLSLKGVSGKYWNIFVLFRWSIVSIILVVLRDFSSEQILLNISLSWLF